MAEEPKTVLGTIQSGTAWLEKRGVPEARLNMEYMLAHTLGLRRLDLYLQFDRPLGENELVPLRVLLQRRGKREPLQHLLGTVDFAGHSFHTDARALIPRPETEQLLVKLCAQGGPPSADGQPRVLDVGCGSGVLGLSLALAWPDAMVTLSDIHDNALALARENAATLGLGEPRVRFINADLLAGFPACSFDLIVANLPYIPSAEILSLAAELAYDPASALDGGADGLGLIRILAQQAPEVMAPGGRLALEIGSGQSQAVAELLSAAGLHTVSCELDFEGHDRFVFACKSPD